jgi:hypothetical protein
MIEKPKKERRFLKTLGKIGEILLEEVLIKVGSNLIKRIGGKKTLPSILFLFLSISLYAQYPATGNKQRLGYQTTGDGLVYRGRALDTMTIKSSGLNNAYFILDTVNNILYNYIKTKGGWKFSNGDTIIINGVTMPFDSITFNTTKDGTVITGEVEYNDTQGSLIQGLKGGLVTNVIGQQLHQRVNNRTGSTLAKGTAVYLSGSQGNRITVAKALGVTDAFSANTFGIVAESILNNQSGYIITEGLITNINTSALVEDSAVYLSPTVAGGLTSTKPQAPQHTVYIGVCVKSNAGSGELFVKIRNGQELDELHDVRISSPVNQASLYYLSSQGIWRDTTAALLVSDTASMLTNYLRTGVAASTYLTQSSAASTYLPLTGGTLTGLLKNTSQRLTGNITISDFDVTYNSVQTGPSSSETVNLALQQNLGGAQNISMGGNQGGGGSTTNPNIYFTDNRKAYASIGGIHTSLGTNNQSGHIIFTTTPSLNTVALTERMRISQDGSITMGGTLGVTGATTLSGALTVNNATVLNEGSGDFDTRIESDGNANMVFVDASTDRVGIGTASPSKTLDVNGEVKIATVTATPTALLGKDGSNVVGEVALGTGMSVSGGILSVQAAGASATGLVTSFGSQIFGGNKTFNGTVTLNDELNLSSGYLKRGYLSSTSTSITVGDNDTWLNIHQDTEVTITLPLASSYTGREIIIKQTGSGVVTSASSNIIGFTTAFNGSTQTAIINPANYRFATLVSDGTNWVIMQRNN